jgi:chromosome segregation ATPase
MSQAGETVTYSLESVLMRIEGKIDTLQRDVDQKFDTLQRDVNQKFDTLQRDVNQKFDTLQKDVDQKFDTLQKDVNQKFDTLQKDVNQKFDALQKDVTDLKVGQAKLTEKVEGMDKRIERLETEQTALIKDISDLKGFRSLILPAIVAFLSAIVTVGLRAFFMGNKP